MYDGPVIDAFLHSPWVGQHDTPDGRGDVVPWSTDPRLRRVMRTFSHATDDDAHPVYRDRDTVLAGMDAAGVERALLPAKVYYASSREGVELTHRALADVADGSDDRLRCAGTLIPPEHGPATYWDVMRNVEVLVDSVERHGFVGVHLTPSPWGLEPNHKWFWPVYAKCVELSIPVVTYIGMPAPLWPMQPNDPAHLEEIALAFPDLVIVAHHLGDPWLDTILRLAARHDNVYLCTSAWSPKRYPPALLEFLTSRWHGTAGAEKVLFATDAPLLDMDRAVRDVRGLPLTDTQAAAFLHDNARRIFWPDVT